MKISTDVLKSVCSDILLAVDSSALSEVSGLVQLEAHDKTLIFSVTNQQYYVSTKLELSEPTEDFFAAINATLFLKLISKLTTEFIDITISDRSVVVTSNGIYTFPLVYRNEEILRLPVIKIENETTSFEINSSILLSILKYNGKEFAKTDDSAAKKQELFRTHYVDDKGAITMSGGSCVNNFTLEKPIQIFLTDKVTKLFKLLPADTTVKFTMGYNVMPSGNNQTVCSFKTNSVIITTIFLDTARLLATMPVAAVRSLASTELPYLAIINKELLMQALDRLLLFVDNMSTVCTGKFMFYKNRLVIFDNHGINKEEIAYDNEIETIDNENPIIHNFNLMELKLTLDNCEEHINFNFGGDKVASIINGNIINLVPILK